jgi:hypothetical protein
VSRRRIIIHTPSPGLNRALARYRRWQRDFDRRIERASRPRPVGPDQWAFVVMAVCAIIAFLCLCLYVASNIYTEQQIIRDKIEQPGGRP